MTAAHLYHIDDALGLLLITLTSSQSSRLVFVVKICRLVDQAGDKIVGVAFVTLLRVVQFVADFGVVDDLGRDVGRDVDVFVNVQHHLLS